MPSWDWPYSKGEVQVYGPKGSLMARGDGLLFQSATKSTTLENPEGQPVEIPPLPPEKKNGIAYFVWCIRNHKPIEGAAAPELNVAVNEILEAAKESIRTGRSIELLPASPGEASQLYTEGPVILSDTKGLDFGPYLARVVFVVRQNWYAAIPETAQKGQKGRVSVVFEIMRDGSVPQMRLVNSSGSDPLDQAALASIRASTPFRACHVNLRGVT
jgi:TonB family protein